MKSSLPQPHFDGLDILICKIMIWESSSKSHIDLDPPEGKCLILRECEEIEINDTYKELIGKASVRFPRGTVIRDPSMVDGNLNHPAFPIYTERLQNGAIIEKREGYAVAKPNNFKVGQRIRIYLGYYHDQGKIFKNEQDRIREMEAEVFEKNSPDFDGYITKCSVSTPIEIECENLASVLKRKTCVQSDLKTPANTTVNDLLNAGGKYDLLKGTGLKLHPKTRDCEIHIGARQLTPDLTVADVLNAWSEKKLFCYIRPDDDGYPCVQVGRSYYSGKSKDSLLNDAQASKGKLIEFDYHVAQDNLTLMNTDPMFLAVEAQSATNDNKFYRITIRLNPEWTGKNDTEHKKFQELNETRLSQKSYKLIASLKDQNKIKKVDLSQYTLIPYMSSKIGITKAELLEEAKAYFDSYNMNGVEGTLTIFGDYHIKSGEKVELLDQREPEKNGWYLVEEVNTKFGVNGFRQTLKIPYCIARPEKPKQDNE